MNEYNWELCVMGHKVSVTRKKKFEACYIHYNSFVPYLKLLITITPIFPSRVFFAFFLHAKSDPQ